MPRTISWIAFDLTIRRRMNLLRLNDIMVQWFNGSSSSLWHRLFFLFFINVWGVQDVPTFSDFILYLFILFVSIFFLSVIHFLFFSLFTEAKAMPENVCNHNGHKIDLCLVSIDRNCIVKSRYRYQKCWHMINVNWIHAFLTHQCWIEMKTKRFDGDSVFLVFAMS